MTIKTRRPRGGKPPVKMRDIKFDIKAIREIRERKKGHYERWAKESKKGGD